MGRTHLCQGPGVPPKGPKGGGTGGSPVREARFRATSRDSGHPLPRPLGGGSSRSWDIPLAHRAPEGSSAAPPQESSRAPPPLGPLESFRGCWTPAARRPASRWAVKAAGSRRVSAGARGTGCPGPVGHGPEAAHKGTRPRGPGSRAPRRGRGSRWGGARILPGPRYPAGLRFPVSAAHLDPVPCWTATWIPSRISGLVPVPAPTSGPRPPARAYLERGVGGPAAWPPPPDGRPRVSRRTERGVLRVPSG